jgi:hypothetical protein
MKPVIILAFANSNGDDYLPLINKEKKSIYESLLEYDDNDFVNIRLVDNASIEDIFKFFKRYQDQVVIFHYGGHANSTHLILETPAGEKQPADANGLAQLIGQQKELRLVFLNGCATQKQVDKLLCEGVRAVIATTVSITDDNAVEFAVKFYETLAGKETIEIAFKTAKALYTAKYGQSREINIIRGYDLDGKDETVKEYTPWILHLRDNSREVLDWKIPANSAKQAIELSEQAERILKEFVNSTDKNGGRRLMIKDQSGSDKVSILETCTKIKIKDDTYLQNDLDMLVKKKLLKFDGRGSGHNLYSLTRDAKRYVDSLTQT